MVGHRVAANAVYTGSSGHEKFDNCTTQDSSRAVGWAHSWGSYAHSLSPATFLHVGLQRIVRRHASAHGPHVPHASLRCAPQIRWTSNLLAPQREKN